jgi:hypothetical protein
VIAGIGLGVVAGAASFIVPSGAAAKLDTFRLSDGLTGTLRMVPTTQRGCQTPGYLSDLTGKVAGIKVRSGRGWELAINDTKVGTFKASDSITSAAHVTLQPPTNNAVENTLTNVGGTLKVSSPDGTAGSLDLRMENVTGSLKTTIRGSWKCSPGT